MKLFRIFFNRTFVCHMMGDSYQEASEKAAAKYSLEATQLHGYFIG